MENKIYKATCCEKEVKWEEYLLNHGMCDKCMDTLVEESNKKQREDFKEAWIAKDNDEYIIIREAFIKEGNTGWTYETLASGFETEQEAETYLKNIFE